MSGSPDDAVRCGVAAGVGLHTESSTVQPLKDSSRQSREMLSLSYVAVRCVWAARVRLHTESSTVQPLRLNCSVSGIRRRGP
ncbi:hypothetical protein F2Q68_00013360 [Brassica cretica]|uniref:Uncharacterized protein n=1 Tax=Brassica cretica TaxID=69181 RepID=A0A8S9HW64_BRACR|nr:hypothetical protein F2Q68_00013360 [Brassica cretica]